MKTWNYLFVKMANCNDETVFGLVVDFCNLNLVDAN